jgi:hypothetical protein
VVLFTKLVCGVSPLTGPAASKGSGAGPLSHLTGQEYYAGPRPARTLHIGSQEECAEGPRMVDRLPGTCITDWPLHFAGRPTAGCERWCKQSVHDVAKEANP